MCDHPDLSIPKAECLVLISLYTGTNGQNRINKQGWFQTAIVEQWFGIRTSIVSGSILERVSGIFLQKSSGSDQHGISSNRT